MRAFFCLFPFKYYSVWCPGDDNPTYLHSQDTEYDEERAANEDDVSDWPERRQQCLDD